MVTRVSVELRGRQARSEVGAVTVDVPAGLRWLAALLSIGAAGLHFAVGPAHFDEYWLFGWFFVVAAWLQALWAIAVVSAPSRLVMTVGLFGNLLVLGLWMWTRLVAVPLGPDAGHPESFALVDGLAAGFEAVVVVLAAWLWRSARPAGGLSRYLAVALVSLPIMALLGASLASAGGAHGDGEEHEGHQVTSAIAATDAGDPGPATSAPTTTAPATAEEAAALRSALTRGTSLEWEGAHVDVDLLRATPEFFQRTLPPGAYQNWQPASGSVFILSESVHEGALPPEPISVWIVADGGQFLKPERTETSSLHPHHRVTALRFAQPFTAGTVTLSLAEDSDRLTWSALPDSAAGQSVSETAGNAAPPAPLGSADQGGAAAPASQQSDEALPVVVVEATAAGYSPDTIDLTRGQPVIIQFVNPTNDERHFHILDLAPQDLYWLAPDGVTTTAEGDLVPVKMPGRVPDAEALRAAQRLEKHVCDSQYGICLLGENVHMHANPGENDALLFTPNDRGTFEIIDLLNEQYHGTVIVR